MSATEAARAAALSPDLATFKLHLDTIVLASAGDLEAQRSMRDNALAGYADGLTDPVTASFWSVIMARLAAAHGHAADNLALASALCFHAEVFGEGNPARHDELVGEAFAIVDALADGDSDAAEFAAGFLQQHSGDVRPAVLKRANDLRGII